MTDPRKMIDEVMATVPHRATVHSVSAEGLITLTWPKDPPISFLRRLLKPPPAFVNLDSVGSCVWNHIDGARTGLDLANILRESFGAKVEPAEERTATFLAQLARGGFVRLM